MTDAEIRPDTVYIGAGLRIVRWTVLVNGEAAGSFDSRVEAVECVDRLCNTPPPVTKEAILAREGAG
jgi:hypothetical protein